MEIYRQITRQFLNRGAIPELHDFFDVLDNHVEYHDLPESQVELFKKSATTWYDQVIRSDFLNPWLFFPDINEIIFHGKNNVECIFKTKSLFHESNIDSDNLAIAMEVIARKQGQSWNLSSPISSFSFFKENRNLRLTLVHATTSPYGQTKLFIRVPSESRINLQGFSQHQKALEIVNNSSRDFYNLIVAGPTGCGKTTLLKCLLNLTDPNEHCIVLEDTHELRSDRINYTYLCTEGQSFSLDECVSWSLRLSPKRLILGEIRSREVGPFLQAANTGHRGLMATLHANSAKEVPERLALLMSLYLKSPPDWSVLMKLITQGIDLIIFVKDKEIKEIIRPIGSDGKNFFHETLYAKETTIENQFTSEVIDSFL